MLVGSDKALTSGQKKPLSVVQNLCEQPFLNALIRNLISGTYNDIKSCISCCSNPSYLLIFSWNLFSCIYHNVESSLSCCSNLSCFSPLSPLPTLLLFPFPYSPFLSPSSLVFPLLSSCAH